MSYEAKVKEQVAILQSRIEKGDDISRDELYRMAQAVQDEVTEDDDSRARHSDWADWAGTILKKATGWVGFTTTVKQSRLSSMRKSSILGWDFKISDTGIRYRMQFNKDGVLDLESVMERVKEGKERNKRYIERKKARKERKEKSESKWVGIADKVREIMPERLREGAEERMGKHYINWYNSDLKVQRKRGYSRVEMTIKVDSPEQLEKIYDLIKDHV